MIKTIGRYVVEAELGRGSMGRVYRAHDPRVDRHVAVKAIALPPGLTPSQRREYSERFLREARAAGGLSHPGIVTVYDFDEDAEQDVAFIAMEYVAGRSLEDVLGAEGPLPADRVFALGDAVAGALEAAHSAHVVHRDIKPANILVRDADGAVKIADFGVARLPQSELTQAGGTIGSPAYMAPEQVRGEPVDGRADLFSLAVILYEALCGERPFARNDSLSTAYSILHDRPAPLADRVDALPSGADRFFARALAKDPAARFSDAAEFRAALAAVRAAGAEDDRVPAPSRAALPQQHTWQIAALVLLLLVAGISVLAFSQGRRARAASDDARTDSALKAAAHDNAAPAEPGPEAVQPASTRTAAQRTARKMAYLQVDSRSSVKEGVLTLLVDGDEVYSRELAAESGKTSTPPGRRRKRLGRAHEEFDAWIEVAAGTRTIQARVDVPSRARHYEDTLVLDLGPGQSQRLRLIAGRTFGSPLTLKAE